MSSSNATIKLKLLSIKFEYLYVSQYFLNSIETASLPPSELKLKVRVVMLLKNIYLEMSLCMYKTTSKWNARQRFNSSRTLRKLKKIFFVYQNTKLKPQKVLNYHEKLYKTKFSLNVDLKKCLFKWFFLKELGVKKKYFNSSNLQTSQECTPECIQVVQRNNIAKHTFLYLEQH